MWDRALRKAAYVPLSQRIRSERSSKCGVCEFLFGSSKCICGRLVWKEKVVHTCMCRLLIRRKKLYICVCVDFLLGGEKNCMVVNLLYGSSKYL